MRFFASILFFIFCILKIATAQPPCSTIPGMTPQTAIAVCGTIVFNQPNVNECFGPPISGTGACGSPNDSHNAFWYKFHCYQSGTLGFLITPVNLNDDYDWELFDVTGLTDLNQIYTDERLMRSLNLCGSPNGITGCAAAGVDSINCGGATNLINRLVTLQAGNDYMLMVNKWTTFGLGYSLTFSGGTAVITDNTPPVISSVTTVGCNTSLLKVVFSKDIRCSSVTANGSEFSISPAGPVIMGVTSTCVSTLNTITELTIQLQNPLSAGTYNLIVDPGTDANTFTDICGDDIASGLTIPFSISTSAPPLIQSFEYDNCKRDKLVVKFDKPIDCASLTANGSEFSFVPGGPVITGITSDCGTGNYTSQVTLLIATPMPPLSFVNIMIRNGTDGNTLSDTCFSFISEFYTAAFQAPAAPPLPIVDSVQYDKCGPSFMKVFYSRPILCNTISPDGSQFRFWPPIFPGPVNMVSATGDPATCSQGYTNWILVQFSGPVTTAASYMLLHVPGSDSRVIMDTCNSPVSTFSSGGIIRLDVIKPSANFTSQVKWGCVNDTIVLSHPGGIGVNSWIWNFSDGSSASGQTVSPTFPVTSASIDVQLIVSNGTCTDSITQTITLGNAINADFTNNPVDSFCINTPVIFTDASTGTLVDHVWDFGDLSNYNGQIPPAHAYAVSNNYTAKLIVTDNHGCKDTVSKNFHVTPLASIDFTGLKAQYCTGNQVYLTRKISRNMMSYVWDNGDGKTFTNEVNVNFSYANEGTYTITLSGIDRYCGTATISKTVPVYAVPIVKLPSDTVLCQNEQMLIGVAPIVNHTYLWSTGANTSQVLTNIFTRDYTLTADNNGCKGYDAMHVKVLSACLIKMPNAFTPNRDGLNDQLRATNADLAKNFSLKIFNRLGQLVFATNNPLEGWDGIFKGNPAETATYVWMLSYTDPWNGKAVKEKGTSILLR
jgi:gliding motility-associated-like protein